MNREIPTSARWLLGLGSLILLGGDEPLQEGFSRIQGKTLIGHVRFLSSEECAGRDTPSPGLDRAAEYLAEQFRQAGLEAGGEPPIGGGEKGFFRPWDWSIPATGAGAYLRLESTSSPKGAGSRKLFEPEKDFYVIEGCAQKEAEGEPLFLGYGIEAAKYRYNDFFKGDPRGKILLVLSHEPREKEKGNAFEGVEATKYSSVYQKAKDASKFGAAGLLVISDPKNHSQTGPILLHPKRSRVGSEPVEGSIDIPVMSISLAAAEEILGKKLAPVQEAIDRTLSSQAIACPGKKLSMKAAIDTRPVRPKNVVAFRKGTDPLLSEEVVVLGAHYDHVGTDDRGVIWPGADDNASGTSVLIEVAKSFAKVPTPRTVLFVAFSGEEEGLYGSADFVRNPTFPTSSMIAMVNIDMVGRGKKDEVYVEGLKFCPGMEAPLDKAQRKKSLSLQVKLDMSERLFDRSDQAGFYKAGIPVLFFIGNPEEHADYHRSTDTADKIDPVKMQSCARLIYLLVHQLATDKAKPERPKPKDDKTK